MTVRELASLMLGLTESGFGDKEVVQYYDSNFACIEVGGHNFRVTSDAVEFPDRGFPFEEGTC